MQRKLSNSINSLFSGSLTTVQSLIREAKLSKTDFTNILNSFNSGSIFTISSMPKANEFSMLEREPVVELFRTLHFHQLKMFQVLNTTGVIVDSITDVLSSDIDKLEKDIETLENFINNYEFLSGKDDLYNANYVEKFDNTLNDYTSDGYSFLIPDRNGVPFPADGNIFIDTSSGLMKIGSQQKNINIINNIKSINISSNYDQFVTSNYPFENLFNDIPTDSWSVTVKSPVILRAKLNEFEKYFNYDTSAYSGAFTVVDLKLKSSIEFDTVRFNPVLGNGLDLMQVVVFETVSESQFSSNSSESYRLLLNRSKKLDSRFQLYFDKVTTDRIIFIFNQSLYYRSKKSPIISELNSKAINAEVDKNSSYRRFKFSKNQDIAYWYFADRFLIQGIKNNSKTDEEYYSYRFPQEIDRFAAQVEEELFRSSNYELSDRPIFSSSPLFSNLVKSMLASANIDAKFLGTSYVYNINSGSDLSFLNNSGFIGTRSFDKVNHPSNKEYYDNNGSESLDSVIKSLMVNEPVDAYEYAFGLRNIDFATTMSANAEKGCFVSRKIPVDGTVLAMKAKVQTVGAGRMSAFDGYDLLEPCSFELSVATEDYPEAELNWSPIPFNNESTIRAEVVFFDHVDLSYSPRFIPIPDSIILYKDGKFVDINKYIYRPNNKIIELLDRNIFSGSSIFCISYQIDTSLYNPYELDFVKTNLFKESTRRFRSGNDLGQRFSSTDSNDSVTLDYVPYINRTYLKNARYDSYFGTLFSGESNGYSPVKVKLANGAYAFNLTNYISSGEIVQFHSYDFVYFIHSGNKILFNKKITSPFYVEYEYIPFSLRFRFVMRKTIPSISIPVHADSVSLKMKTTFFDPYYDKLMYISKL